jgi:hypothetical protein
MGSVSKQSKDKMDYIFSIFSALHINLGILLSASQGEKHLLEKKKANFEDQSLNIPWQE